MSTAAQTTANQTNRALRARKLQRAEAASVPAIADINEMTKQTQSEVTAEALELAFTMTDYQVKTFQANAMRDRADAGGCRTSGSQTLPVV